MICGLMSSEYGTFPSRGGEGSEAIRRMLSARRIAVVGLSDDPSRPGFGVASFLRSAGKQFAWRP